jgi:hypothetical protein
MFEYKEAQSFRKMTRTSLVLLRTSLNVFIDQMFRNKRGHIHLPVSRPILVQRVGHVTTLAGILSTEVKGKMNESQQLTRTHQPARRTTAASRRSLTDRLCSCRHLLCGCCVPLSISGGLAVRVLEDLLV